MDEKTKATVLLVIGRLLVPLMFISGLFFGYGIGQSTASDYDSGVKHALSCMLEPEYYEPGQIYVQAMECSRKLQGDWPE